MLFDSHCHLTDERFAADLPAVLERAWQAGLVGLVSIASDAKDAEAAAALAAADPRLRATAGIHPHTARDADEEAFRRVEDLLGRDEVVAVGEAGLDYHYDNSPRDAQRKVFRRQLELAARTGLPIVVHSREADGDTAALIEEAGRDVRGVLHCFAGGDGLLDAGLRNDWYVSFSGMVTFRSWSAEDLVRRVPADRLLVETDSPYLAPVPHRGGRNEPAYVARVVERLAEMLGEDGSAVAERTTENARRFYRLEA